MFLVLGIFMYHIIKILTPIICLPYNNNTVKYGDMWRVLMNKKVLEYYIPRPKNPKNNDVHKDRDGLQWKFIDEINNWALDLSDPETNSRYHAVDDYPKGKPTESGIVGEENVFRWLDENS